ncbi:MAG: JAB domain-containing protein, partial [Methanothrix sp.]|nr:JAB domain-containing protein [Methanothrix sp.]
MSTSIKPIDRLIVAEKAVLYRKVRSHSIPLPIEAVDSAEKAKLLLEHLFDQKPVEDLYVIALNSSGDFLGMIRLAEGTVDRASVYPRELLSFLLLETNATSILIAHSHPGGKAEPSTEDMALTNRLKDLLLPIVVRLLDHFIYACGRPGRPA